MKKENKYLQGKRKLIGLNSQEMEKFKRKFGKDHGFFQDKYLNPKRTKWKEYAEGTDQIISSKAHQEEQETKSRWMETKTTSRKIKKMSLRETCRFMETVQFICVTFFFFASDTIDHRGDTCYLTCTNLVDSSGAYVLCCAAYL